MRYILVNTTSYPVQSSGLLDRNTLTVQSDGIGIELLQGHSELGANIEAGHARAGSPQPVAVVHAGRGQELAGYVL